MKIIHLKSVLSLTSSSVHEVLRRPVPQHSSLLSSVLYSTWQRPLRAWRSQQFPAAGRPARRWARRAGQGGGRRAGRGADPRGAEGAGGGARSPGPAENTWKAVEGREDEGKPRLERWAVGEGEGESQEPDPPAPSPPSRIRVRLQ